MIIVGIKYGQPTLDDTIFGDQEQIGFYRWANFKDYINRLIRWRVPFQLVSVLGVDASTGDTRAQAGLVACEFTDCNEHETVYISSPIGRYSIKQTEELFIALVNRKVRNVLSS